MGKLDKEQKDRMDGMNYTLTVARESLESMCTTLLKNMKTAFSPVSIKKFEFGEKRLKKINKAYEEKTMELFDFDRYGEHFVTFEDMARELREKYHIDVQVETVKENQESFDERNDRRILPNIIELLEHENQHEAADVLREHLHEAVAVW